MIGSAVIAWAIILVGALSATVWLKLSPSRTIPVGYFAVIIVGFVAGLLNQLGSLRWLIPVGSLALLAKAVFVVRTLTPSARLSRLGDTLLKPGLLVFVMGSGILFWVAYGRRFTQWDEFSHWGLAAKNMHLLDAFPNVEQANTFFRTYPPGTTTLEYFFTGYDANFSDAAAIAAFSTFCLAILLPLADRLPKRLWKLSPFVAATLAFLPLSTFPDANTSIYVDSLLGLLAAYVLLIHFGADRVGRREIFQETMGVVVLSLIKPSGLGLAALVTVILVADQINRSHREGQAIRGLKPLRSAWWFGVAKTALPPVIPLLSGLVASRVWNLELEATHTPEATSISLGQMIDVFGAQDTANQDAIRSVYVDALGNRLGSTGLLTAANIAVACAVILWLLSRTYPKGSLMRGRVSALALAAPVCAGLYWWSLLALYMYSFSDYEGIRLASFARYQGTFVLFLIVLLLDQLLARSSGDYGKAELRQPSAIVAALLCGTLIPWGLAVSTVHHAKGASATTRLTMAEYEVPPAYLASLRSSGERVYYIHSGSNGYGYWAFRFAVAPSQVSPNFSWSFGPNTGPNATWNTDVTVADWKASLRNDYEFVYVYHFDEYFADKFSTAFCPGQVPREKTLFAVSEVGRDSVCLIRVSDFSSTNG